MALIMAGAGHEVTAIDCTRAMLEKAEKNAEKYNRTICFDLVLTRNLIWNLEQPEMAYQEFFRILSPGGRVLNFDANWYLHLHDPVKRQAYEKDRLNAKKHNCLDHYTCTDTKTMECIAGDLPQIGRCF